MTEPLDPDRLGEALDRHLPPGSDQVSARLPDDPAVRAAVRLATGPKPMLDPAARARMRVQVLTATLAVAPSGPSRVIRYAAFALASAAAVALALFGVVGALNRSSAGATPTPVAVAAVTETGTPTDEPTPTSLPPSATPTLTATTVPPTATDEPTATPPPPTWTPVPPTPTPSRSPSEMPPTAVPSLPPVVEPTAEHEVRLTLEGVVEAIDGRVLTISGIEIELAEDDPLLDVLWVNDRVRIEGELVRGPSRFLIDGATIELANDNAAENEVEEGPRGELWRDSGDCNNPPPAWAKAYGWRARCEGASAPGNSAPGGGPGAPGSNGQGNGRPGPNPPENPGPPKPPGNPGGKGKPGGP